MSESNVNLSDFEASLNFAYCSSIPLSLNPEYILKEDQEIFHDFSKNLDKDSKELLFKSIKYFYICYSLQINEIINEEKNNYFYFQTFSQIGTKQAGSNPIYGFYTQEKILEKIKDVSSIFVPEGHNKHIIDTIQNDLNGEASELIKMLQEWTSVKLLDFNNLYFQDKDTMENLYKLISYEDSGVEKKKTNSKKKRRKY